MTKNAQSAQSRLRSLEEAASGLLFPSETDAPLVPIELAGAQGADLSAEGLLNIEKREAGTKVEEVTADELFAPLIEAGDDDAKKYGRILELLKAELTDLRVYRVGSTDIDVYVLGKHSSGAWVGLKTKVVET
jgi:hypothetical protein